MQFLNKNVKGHVEVGHIDLQNTISFFDVAEDDADRVMKYLTGAKYKGREVRCNDGESGDGQRSKVKGTRDSVKGTRSKGLGQREVSRKDKVQSSKFFAEQSGKAERKVQSSNDGLGRFEKKKKAESKRGQRGAARMESGRKDDWRQFFQGGPIELVGEEPDFSEEGWARRKPKK
jgi:ATP-dependent RNA helicase DeaD